ncbi:unnamed protein product [Diatraea saccharalis]|uniref:Mutator-like transposase domain-containing protein n=1 Tax=Diatraea saccharalis TaxID=40085 RepID=A0A9N9N0Y3_9NEOP|nr:unnamed protein product [Diatraea saccharalis]
MPKKIGRSDRQSTGSRLYRPKKNFPPHKRKSENITTKSASAKKIKMTVEDQIREDLERHYRVIDFLLVFATIATLVKCVKCDGKVNFHSTKKEGLGFHIKVSYESYKQITNVPSSARINSGIYEVNYRFVFVILGLGLVGCDKFCGLMDLSSSFLSRPTYNNYVKKMCSTIREVANRFFSSATKKERAATAEEKNLKMPTNSVYQATEHGKKEATHLYSASPR